MNQLSPMPPLPPLKPPPMESPSSPPLSGGPVMLIVIDGVDRDGFGPEGCAGQGSESNPEQFDDWDLAFQPNTAQLASVE